MVKNSFSKIRFIGYAIPTTPDNLISIGDPNGPGAVAGSYLGNADFETDVLSRIKILKFAVDTAKAKILSGEEGVINLFVCPEFYFHSLNGPYIYTNENADPISFISKNLSSTFSASNYPNWMFVFGSVITSMIKNDSELFKRASTTARNEIVKTLSKQWQKTYGPLKGVIFDMLVNFVKVCHSYPSCEVRNRSIIINNMGINPPQSSDVTNLMTTEKYFVSNEDFLLYDTNDRPNVITEQMTAYPTIDLSAGDSKQNAFDKYAIFRQGIDIKLAGAMDYGVEICLDHSDVRLRRNIDNQPSPIVAPHIQIIPSCGMQIIAQSVATDQNGMVFNCDGQYTLNANKTGYDNIKGVDSLFANYSHTQHPSKITYGAHSQLARVKTPATGGNPLDSASKNATFHSLDSNDIQVLNIKDVANSASLNIDDYYAGGSGQLHLYGFKMPYSLY